MTKEMFMNELRGLRADKSRELTGISIKLNSEEYNGNKKTTNELEIASSLVIEELEQIDFIIHTDKVKWGSLSQETTSARLWQILAQYSSSQEIEQQMGNAPISRSNYDTYTIKGTCKVCKQLTDINKDHICAFCNWEMNTPNKRDY